MGNTIKSTAVVKGEETDENRQLIPSHWQPFYTPGRDSNRDSGERRVAVSGNAIDHKDIRAGPTRIVL